METRASLTSVPLSADTRWVVDRLFKPEHRVEAARMLEAQCARNLPSCQKADAGALERLRFAALKVSRGELNRLSHAMREAQMDWRDMLMAAEFGVDVNAHRAWFEELRSK